MENHNDLSRGGDLVFHAAALKRDTAGRTSPLSGTQTDRYTLGSFTRYRADFDETPHPGPNTLVARDGVAAAPDGAPYSTTHCGRTLLDTFTRCASGASLPRQVDGRDAESTRSPHSPRVIHRWAPRIGRRDR